MTRYDPEIMSGRWHPRSCRRCGARTADGVYISARGLCPECGDDAQLENTKQMRAKSGPRFDRWRHRVAASVGAVMPER